MKRIAITGISGYIGSRLLAELNHINNVERIIGIDVNHLKYSSPKLQFYCQDIFKPLGDIFVENEVDTAIHLTFILKPTPNRAGAEKVDIGGLRNFLQACHQAKVKHILYLSSHTVYGAHPDNSVPLKETSPLRPLPGFQYSWDKAKTEQILSSFVNLQKDVCLTILRSCPVIGPNAGSSIVTSMFKPIMIRVAGYDPLMQFVHEDDLIELIVTLLSQKRAGIFNVASDGEIQYTQIAALAGRRTITLPDKMLRFLMGFSWGLRLQNESPASGLEFIKYPPIVSTEKLKREVGFQFRYSSRDAVAAFVNSQRATQND